MEPELESFISDYAGEDPNSISRFREYREKSGEMAGYFILIIIVAVIVHEALSFRIREVPPPLSRYGLYGLLIFPILGSLLIRWGLRDVDMNHARFSYHQLREAIHSFGRDEHQGVFDHMEELNEDIDNSNNKVFSKRSQTAISDFYDQIDEAEMTESVIEDEFEDVACTLVNEIQAGENIEELTSSAVDDGQFERSVLVDAAQNVGLRPLQVLPVVVVGISVGVYFYVDKDAGYAIGMLSLAALEVINRS